MTTPSSPAPTPPAPTVRGRFAPSPSGRMHLGNVWCALLAWLSSRAQGGQMVLRIEDLDTTRCKPVYAAQLEYDLDWLGLTWDEGGSAGGPNGPYLQSQCAPLYAAALTQLAEAAPVYPCFCTRADLHAASAPHLADGTLVYSGRCRSLTDAQRMQAQSAGRRSALRVAVPNACWAFEDGLLGPVQQNLAQACGDFIVRRSDGVYAYQLAVVVDDARMGITEVVRGQDLLTSTPRQLWLFSQLGLTPPCYRHVPLLCAPDGRRLSKREGDLDMGALRARYTAPQLLGRLAALAGLVPPGQTLTAQQLVPLFSWEKVPKTPLCIAPDMF